MIEVRVFEDGEELEVSEVDEIDSADPGARSFNVYVIRN